MIWCSPLFLILGSSTRTKGLIHKAPGRPSISSSIRSFSKSILTKKWRQINYESVIEDRNYLSRRLRKMLGLKFTYASPNRSFNINLSTLIENSGISLYERMSDNLKYAEKVLKGMSDIVGRFALEKKFTVHPITKKGACIS